MKLTLSANLQQLMRLHGNISVSDLARLTAIPQPTIHHILTGSTKNPRKKALEALSSYFSVSIKQLLGQEALPTIIPKAVKEELKISTIPIIEWNILKNWPESADKNQNEKQILIDKKLAPDSFALLMQDSSMEPLFQENTLLIFDSGKPPSDRDFVIVYLENENLIVFDRLFTENKINYIKQSQADGNFKLIRLEGTNHRILGTLIEARIQY